MAIQHQTAKVTLEVPAVAVYTSRHPRNKLQTGMCAKILLHHPVKYDLWNVTMASVVLIINGDGSSLNPPHKGNGVICCGGGP